MKMRMNEILGFIFYMLDLYIRSSLESSDKCAGMGVLSIQRTAESLSLPTCMPHCLWLEKLLFAYLYCFFQAYVSVDVIKCKFI